MPHAAAFAAADHPGTPLHSCRCCNCQWRRRCRCCCHLPCCCTGSHYQGQLWSYSRCRAAGPPHRHAVAADPWLRPAAGCSDSAAMPAAPLGSRPCSAAPATCQENGSAVHQQLEIIQGGCKGSLMLFSQCKGIKAIDAFLPMQAAGKTFPRSFATPLSTQQLSRYASKHAP